LNKEWSREGGDCESLFTFPLAKSRALGKGPLDFGAVVDGDPIPHVTMNLLGGCLVWKRGNPLWLLARRTAWIPLVLLILTGCETGSEPTSTGLTYYPGTPSPNKFQGAIGGAAPSTDGQDTPFPGENEWRQAAARWNGTPYRDGGHDRQGVDCSGYTDSLYREVVGRGIPRTSMGQWLEGKAISVENMRPGDLVFFHTTGPGVSHVGLVLSGIEFTHASSSRGVMISTLNDTYWRERFLGARRMSP